LYLKEATQTHHNPSNFPGGLYRSLVGAPITALTAA